MTPVEYFLKSCREQDQYAGQDDLTFGLKWLEALETLAGQTQTILQETTLQEEIIYMGCFTRLMDNKDQNRYLACCEKLLPVDCILEILDKNPSLKYGYKQESGLIRSYLNLMQ